MTNIKPENIDELIVRAENMADTLDNLLMHDAAVYHRQTAQALRQLKEIKRVAAMAFGVLWHISEDRSSPVPLYLPDEAATAAKRILTSALNKSELGSGIDGAKEWLDNKATQRSQKVSNDIDKIADRFLSWPIPKTICPDGGISFNPPKHPNSWPVGTNFLDAKEAREMVEYLFGDYLRQLSETQNSLGECQAGFDTGTKQIEELQRQLKAAEETMGLQHDEILQLKEAQEEFGRCKEALKRIAVGYVPGKRLVDQQSALMEIAQEALNNMEDGDESYYATRDNS